MPWRPVKTLGWALCVLLAAGCGHGEGAACAMHGVACGQGTPRHGGGGKGAPLLRVGTSGDYAPFSIAGRGFDVEVAERMASDLGYRIAWAPFTWPELRARVAANAFDVAMGGITWRPERAVVGAMSRAVALGGPCELRREPLARGRIGVNRGGVLERWAREHYPEAQILAVDDNVSLPGRLARGEIDVVVTDRFEVGHFTRAGFLVRCEPARDRKVYWVAPARASTLAPRIDAWLARHEPELRQLRRAWFGRDATWTPTEHLLDLVARRLSLMPAVSAYKRAHGLPVEDRAREALVLERAITEAARAGLDTGSVRAFFAAQIALAKAVQRRSPQSAVPMDLREVLRPALSSLDKRIVAALAACASHLPRLDIAGVDLLAPVLRSAERQRLLAALQAVRAAHIRQ